MTENERKSANTARLQKVYAPMRPKIEAIIRDLESHGFQPLIDSHVYRTPAEQAQMVKRGVSHVRYSFHNVTGKNGTPEALACDITDARWGWSSPLKYWLMLAASAEAHGLTTGIRWGLSKWDRAQIDKAIKERSWESHVRLGWDAAHIEAVFSLTKARLGFRPKL